MTASNRHYEVAGSTTSGNVVEGNYIGTDAPAPPRWRNGDDGV